MNAYELADFINAGGENIDRNKLADILRQQADRIAELSKNVDELEEELLKATHQNSEPVAYVNSMCNDCIDWKIEPMSIDGQPLYTTPQIKELSDAEIRTIQDMCHLKNVGYNTFIMRFARAILKKAREK